jgi:hypothetical protein
VYRIDTGAHDLNDIGTIVEWQPPPKLTLNDTEQPPLLSALEWWRSPEANMLNGSDGTHLLVL